MADALTTLKTRLANLRQERAELALIQKEAFMASPPMPGGGGMPPQGMPPGMDPSMMGGMPPQGMPPGMPPGMDPSMMGGMPPQGMPPQGMPVDPATGMPMDPNAMGGQQPPASPLTPEMLEELIGVVEQLAAGQEKTEQALQQMAQQQEEIVGQFEEMQQQLAQMFSAPQPGAGGM